MARAAQRLLERRPPARSSRRQRPGQLQPGLRRLERRAAALVQVDRVLEGPAGRVGVAARRARSGRRRALGRAQRTRSPTASAIAASRAWASRAAAQLAEPDPDRHEQLERGGALDRLLAAEAAQVALGVAQRRGRIVVVEASAARTRGAEHVRAGLRPAARAPPAAGPAAAAARRSGPGRSRPAVAAASTARPPPTPAPPRPPSQSPRIVSTVPWWARQRASSGR